MTGYEWNFGDGTTANGVDVVHRYAAAGEYTLTLNVRDDAGVGNSIVAGTQVVRVEPAPDPGLMVTSQICAGVETPWFVTAPDGTQVDWSFDGVTAQGAETTHVFPKPGMYPVTARLDDGAGLPGSLRIAEVYQRVNATPSALAGPDRTVCPGDVVVFDAGSSSDLDGQITDYEWIFSDGVMLSGPRVERAFDTSGWMLVTLNVRDDRGATGCDVGADSACVLVNAPPAIDAGADREVKVGASYDVERFDPLSAQDADGHGLRMSWNFGEGADAEGRVVRHRFSTAGTYTVTLTAQDSTVLACGIAQDTLNVVATARD